MIDIDQLRKAFAVPHRVEIDAAMGGLARVVVRTPLAEAHVYLHGAHVTHFSPVGQEDLLFLSGKSSFESGKAIRGGVPLIFPWFGAKAGNAAAPAHGFARTSEWALADVSARPDGAVVVVLELAAGSASRALWPYEFGLRYVVTVGASLELALEVRNLSQSAFSFEEALHTYLAVGDVRSVKVDGLGGREFLDKTDGGKRKLQPDGPISITDETDRVYLNTPDTITVDDPALGRRVSVAKQGSESTVLWNPWIAKAKAMADFGDQEWPGMLCVETANAAGNAVTLGAGQLHRMTTTISSCPSDLQPPA